MWKSTALFSIAALVTQVFSAPQFITFENGKLGVNFGGYHAGVGIGGGAGKGAGGGLYAEAGTPFGQEARAGLGGDVTNSGGASGGLYAGATAGGNVKAEAGLSGAVSGEKSIGSGFANAQAGKAHASSGLGGETSAAASHGFTYSSSKSFTGSTGVKQKEIIKEKEIVPIPVQPVQIHKKIHKEFKLESTNEVKPEFPVQKEFTQFVPLEEQVPSIPPTQVVKEVAYQPVVYEKHIVRSKPRHHFRKTAFLGGYVGAQGAVAPPPPPPPAPVVYKAVQPVIQKRIDIVSEGAAPPPVQVDNYGAGQGQVAYTKQVTFQRNPNFFADIFNIPISTLKAVGNFLGNTAASTSVSVQKSASIQSGGHAYGHGHY